MLSVDYMAAGIEEGMAPFRPLAVTTYMDRSYKGICVEVKTLPGVIFMMPIVELELEILQYPEVLYRQLALRAGEFFGKIRVEPESNVILGEN